VAQSLSLLFGIEAIIVLKDIWRLDDERARRVAIWAAHALVRAAVAEAASKKAAAPAGRMRRNAARRPRGEGA
jgi:hypothetical protein